MITVTAAEYETWDILAKKYTGWEYNAKDIMLQNPHLSDVVIFDGGEQVNIPEDTDT